MPQLTSAILDSSPVHIPKPLKRSSSSTSLPTPPRTNHKKRSRSRASSDLGSSSDSDTAPKKRKHAREGNTQAADGDEEAFWLGGGSAQPQGPRTPSTISPSPPPPALLQYRSRTLNKESSLASPPPSRRQSSVNIPVTPERTGEGVPVRDSPNNPFLSHGTPLPPRVVGSDDEQPTVTYVFRGTKRTFANPHYNLPPSTFENSHLPVDHPDFSPGEKCEPRLLFPGARKKRAVDPFQTRRRRVEVDSDEEEEEDGDSEGGGGKGVKLFQDEGIRRSPRLAAKR